MRNISVCKVGPTKIRSISDWTLYSNCNVIFVFQEQVKDKKQCHKDKKMHAQEICMKYFRIQKQSIKCLLLQLSIFLNFDRTSCLRIKCYCPCYCPVKCYHKYLFNVISEYSLNVKHISTVIMAVISFEVYPIYIQKKQRIEFSIIFTLARHI